MTENNDLKGLSGWLILVGIGVIFYPIRLIFINIPMYKTIFEDGTWEVLTTVDSEAYNSLWAPLLLGEITYNSIMVASSVYLTYLFFSKHYLFSKFYIGIVTLSIVFIPLDAWFVTKVLQFEPMFDPEITIEFMRTLIAGIIWILYMLISKRVKATFVESLTFKNRHSETDTIFGCWRSPFEFGCSGQLNLTTYFLSQTRNKSFSSQLSIAESDTKRFRKTTN